MPLCLGASGSVRASNMPSSADCPPDVHTFCPLITHSSPSRSAFVCRLARSDPAPGSLKSWHQPSCPVTIGRRYRSFCSSVPCVRIVGPASSTPSPDGGPTAPAARSSSPTIDTASRPKPRPNHSVGHVGVAHPDSPNRSHHSATVRSGSQFSLSQVRNSSRTASGLAVAITRLRVSVEELVDLFGWSGDDCPIAPEHHRTLHQLGVLQQHLDHGFAIFVGTGVEPELLEPLVVP